MAHMLRRMRSRTHGTTDNNNRLYAARRMVRIGGGISYRPSTATYAVRRTMHRTKPRASLRLASRGMSCI